MPSTERYAPFRLMIGLFCLIIGLFNAETMHYTLQSITAVNSSNDTMLHCAIKGMEAEPETMVHLVQLLLSLGASVDVRYASVSKSLLPYNNRSVLQYNRSLLPDDRSLLPDSRSL